ncbi:hypothetical protein BGM09_06380 [Streptomyces sp. CBMA29]|nr:hypothetical protein [Streptomyces sp. CBMA29]
MGEAIPRAVAVDRMGPGDHACLGFHSDDDRWAVRAAFTVAGLALGERVMIFTGGDTAAPDALARLSAHGVPAERCAHTGQLALSSESPGYDPASGAFDRAVRTAFWAAGTSTARRRGFTGMRVVGDMTWAAAAHSGLPEAELSSYEAELTPFSARTGFTAMCEYDHGAVPAPLLSRIAALHPLAVLPSLDTLHADRTGRCLRLTGTADLATRLHFGLTLRAAFTADPPPALLDLTPLSFLDAHCATAALRLPPGTTVRCTPSQHRMLRVCGAAEAEAEGVTFQVEDPPARCR